MSLHVLSLSILVLSPNTNCCCCLVAKSDSFATPWTAACLAPLSVGFPRQEYWSGLPCPPLGDLPNSGFEPRSPTLQADYLPSEPPGKPNSHGSQFIRTQIHGGKNPCRSSNTPSTLHLRPLRCFPCSECPTSVAGLSL